MAAEELCSVTGWTDSMHRKLAVAGYFPAPVRGKYQSDQTLHGIIRYLKELLRKKDDTLEKEKQGLTAARRKTVEKELAILNGEYVKKSEIGPALRNLSLHQRATLQRKFEQEIATKLDGLTPVERLLLIKGAVDEVCAIFQEGTSSWISEPECKPKSTS